jgi:hypothetical protein
VVPAILLILTFAVTPKLDPVVEAKFNRMVQVCQSSRAGSYGRLYFDREMPSDAFTSKEAMRKYLDEGDANYRAYVGARRMMLVESGFAGPDLAFAEKVCVTLDLEFLDGVRDQLGRTKVWTKP